MYKIIISIKDGKLQFPAKSDLLGSELKQKYVYTT